MPDPPPIDKGLGTSTVLVMLGTDTAGKTLAELAAATTPTTGAGGVAPPAAVGVTTTTTDEALITRSASARGVLDAPARLATARSSP